MAPHIVPGRVAAALALAFATAAFAPASQADIRTMIVTSDPQYPWTPSSDTDEAESEADRDERSRALIEEQYRSIAAYRAARPGQDIPVFINGDITAYGHGWQRSVMAELLQILGDNVHIGLGNHDYANNIRASDGGGCYNNGCARDSIDGLVQHVTRKREKVAFDFATQPGVFGDDYEGSLAYAVRAPGMDRVLNVQLNNYPSYEVTFDSYAALRKSRYRITSSVPWLENLLKTNLTVPPYGKPSDRPFDFAIVHMHNADADGANFEFASMVASNDVAAIFAGHLHAWAGQYGDIGGVPVFLSGSASRRTYLIVEHDTDASELRVYRVSDNDPDRKTLAGRVHIPQS
ncbi:phosphoesterase [Luteibacter jiangsuensis]|uniref:Phosphoesterase n=1 Tax=Luteibacter jiangsuensis TaxID=637577 RepID=A0ABX0Q312_9GAMM|nr:metallophosphoesterase [Luteibacter jiangsuensis]NID04116.1 phosphoesterase [Luteibacter jiangsuensis]